MRVKHKNLHSTASQFVVTCVVWSLVAAVFLNMAAYRPQAGIAPVSEAAAAPAVAALQDTAGQPQQASTSSQASQQSPHSSSQAGLQPQDYKNTALVVVTTTSSPYLQFTRNWAAHLARIGANHAVIALDQQSFKVLTEQERLPAVLDASENAKQLGLNTDVSVRKEFAQLRHLGYLRIGLPLQLMQQYNWQAMILSDADVVWLRHPSELMQLYPHAELLVSTDCLSAKAVMQNQTDVYRCGMQPGGWNSAWNSGVVGVRNTPKALAAVTAWQDSMAPGSVSKSPEGWWIDDQLALTRLLDAESLPYQGVDNEVPSAAPTEAAAVIITDSNHTSNSTTTSNMLTQSSTIWAWKRQLKVVALPPLVVAGGHVALWQHLPEAYNFTPWAIHFTYQAKYDGAGKILRAREANLWLIDPPEPPGSRYLTYHNMVEVWLEEVEAVWQQHTGRKLAHLHKHQLAAAFQLQVLTEGFAAAHVLNRTLVPPSFVCYCTQDSTAWTDTLLHNCTIAGSDKLPPFACTMENLVNIVEQQQLYSPYAHALKTPNFLTTPAMRRIVKDSTVAVQWTTATQHHSAQESTQQQQQEEDPPTKKPADPNDVLTLQLLNAMGSTATGPAALNPTPVVLPLKVTGAQLRQALGNPLHASSAGAAGAAAAAAVVVDLGRIAPGWFAGLESESDGEQVRELVNQLTASVGWCCLLEAAAEEKQDVKDRAFVHFQQPVVPVVSSESLDQPGVMWVPAVSLFQRPEWCTAQNSLTPLNRNVSLFAEHPCTYLAGASHDVHALMQGVAAAMDRVHERRV